MAENIYLNTEDVSKMKVSGAVQRASRPRRWLFPALITGVLIIIIIIIIIEVWLTYVMLRNHQWSLEQQVSSIRNESQRHDQSIATLRCGIYSILSNDSAVDGCCPNNWTHSGFSCYFFSKFPLTWNKSKTWCENKDSHLVKFNTDKEWNFITSKTSSQLYWIGLSDWRTGKWEWVDQTEYIMDSRHWRPGQPDNWKDHGHGDEGEDCAHLITNGFNDLCCFTPLKFICQKPSGRP
ncbi:C-type lectin domain family 10 member A-like [Cynoglossus semilaevis]|uniref:C-type lectin domain family 10 member A-like n=1 Tax=Cynoglossus semilaevis TaxID=244447 RepID=A0A3P8V218_CYNSE|nr:C-type lectin domain family 10 member A-like [Cynoglossus semilaevis]